MCTSPFTRRLSVRTKHAPAHYFTQSLRPTCSREKATHELQNYQENLGGGDDSISRETLSPDPLSNSFQSNPIKMRFPLVTHKHVQVQFTSLVQNISWSCTFVPVPLDPRPTKVLVRGQIKVSVLASGLISCRHLA